MPTIRQSQNVSTQGWTKAAPQPVVNAAAPAAPDPQARNPFMHAAMPLQASTSDAFPRQFYGGSNVPTYRLLPAQRGGGS